MPGQTPGAYWGTDVPISMPEVNPNNPIIVDMGAIGFGEFGIEHNISTSDLEDYLQPTFVPSVGT